MRFPILSTAIATLCFFTGSAHAARIVVPTDQATIQAAVDAALPGDTIVVRSGRYTQPVQIRLKTDLILEGKGRVILEPIGVTSGVVVVNSSGIQLRNLEVRNPTAAGFDVFDSTGVLLEKCRVRDPGDYGFYLATGNVGITLDECTVQRAAVDGIHAVQTDMLELRACTLRHSAQRGLFLHGSTTAAVVEGCEVEGAGSGTGMKVEGSGHLLRNNSVTLDGAGSALDLAGVGHRVVANRFGGNVGMTGSLHSLRDNRFARLASLFMDGASDCSVIGNRIRRPDLGGMIVVNSTRCLLEDNRITGSRVNGIVLVTSTATCIRSNRIRDCAEHGLLMGMSAIGNTVLRNQLAGSGRADLNDFNPAHSNVYVANEYGSSLSLP